MNLTFHNKKITGLLSVVPAEAIKFEDEMRNYNFSEAKSLKLKMAMGYNERRIVKEGTTVSDLCIHGMSYLFDRGLLAKEEIDALILVTQSPDYFMPATSSVIQGHFGLKQDMICMDINQGCAGFIVGIFQAFMLLEQEEIKKVVLLNADVLSRKVSKQDRNSSPLIGDAASVTILERGENTRKIVGNIKMDGAGAQALMIPAGGFKLPSNTETAKLMEDSAGNFRSLDNLVMKGDEVFNFVQREVPPMIEELLQKAAVTKAEVDYYLFHQPNKFMLNKLADKLEVPREKMPSNVVEHFGNSSGVSIPMAINLNLKDFLKDNVYLVCLAGFGVGLTWASLLLEMGKLDFCEIIEI
jgi:3-oxoacyl-[acyl-carrier-protein] synthase III